MARINWLADVLRSAGCHVREESQAWKTRGRDTFNPAGIIVHATAGGQKQSNESAYDVLVNGRVGLAGPIAHVMIERGTLRWRPVASGASNHAKSGWGGNCAGLGNSQLIGIEAHHDNLHEPWTEQALDNYARGVAAIARRIGVGTGRIALHKEHQPREKSDTTFNGDAFRRRVQAYLNGSTTSTPAPTPQGDDDDMKGILANVTGKDTVWYGTTEHGHTRALTKPESLSGLTYAGASRQNYDDPAALVEALGWMPGDTDGSKTLEAVNKNG
jgi:hypothetical protein